MGFKPSKSLIKVLAFRKITSQSLFFALYILVYRKNLSTAPRFVHVLNPISSQQKSYDNINNFLWNPLHITIFCKVNKICLYQKIIWEKKSDPRHFLKYFTLPIYLFVNFIWISLYLLILLHLRDYQNMKLEARSNYEYIWTPHSSIFYYANRIL